MIRRFTRNRVGTAATEFALTLPLMLALIFGSMEAGHFSGRSTRSSNRCATARASPRGSILDACVRAIPRWKRKFKISPLPANWQQAARPKCLTGSQRMSKLL
ncbi:MAG: hypothetical protein CVT85_10345 [Alphaproteobacteria bacterium HGW-Alphaproteobacteria-7]|nr:MAG: hypothetical protein CVT85_10345 [Alphaproteobacteria bacterium HGW-Alphaproteobacteria-7]